VYKDLNKEQKALCLLMSDISEEAWCAGWMNGLEYALWYIMLHGPAKYGWKVINGDTIQQLKNLSEQEECWITFDQVTQETAVSLSEWEAMFQVANPKEYLMMHIAE
jgi:hypothetical protein